MNKKISLLFFVLLNMPVLLQAQKWQALGNGTSNPISSLCIYKGKLYAGGATLKYPAKTNVNGFYSWDGAKWDTVVGGGVQAGPLHINNGVSILAMTVFNGNLFVGGNFDSVNHIYSPNLAEWNGTNWIPIGTPYRVTTLLNYNSALYVAGDDTIFQYGSPNAINTSLGNQGFNAMAVYNGNIYAAGNFNIINGLIVNGLAVWNGTIWDTVGNGMGGHGLPQTDALAAYNGLLYAGGDFASSSANFADISGWNGSVWDSINPYLNPQHFAQIVALTVYNNKLYIGSNFPFISSWDGITFHDSIGGGVNMSGVNAVLGYDSVLYIAGGFDSASGQPARYVAQMIQPTGINELNSSNAGVVVYPNPSSNGLFQLRIKNYELGISNQVEVYNMLGEKVYTSFLNPSKGGTLNSIDINNNPSGIYFYRIIDDKGEYVASGKLIKQ
jgi:hypothetical protein